jgi:hypothetical protein
MVEGAIVHMDTERGALWLTLPARFSIDELSALLGEAEAAARLHRPRVIVRDATHVQPTTISSLHRKAAAEHFEVLVEGSLGPELEVFVLPNAALRGVVTAVSWIFAPPWRREMLGDRAQAERLVAAFLEEPQAPAG